MSTVENGLRSLWEKVKRAGELIGTLREENRSLRVRIDQFEGELRKLQLELQKRDQTIKDLTVSHATAKASGATFPDGEREALVSRVRDLLSRIESYL